MESDKTSIFAADLTKIEFQMLVQVFYILFFYFIGELISNLMGGFIPGSIIGMILLFVSLAFKAVNPEKVSKVSKLLTDNMGLFFVPAGVGLMNSMDIISQFWTIILISSAVSTILVVITVGFIQQTFEKRRAHK